jgi:hypothetical protein
MFINQLLFLLFNFFHDLTLVLLLNNYIFIINMYLEGEYIFYNQISSSLSYIYF